VIIPGSQQSTKVHGGNDIGTEVVYQSRFAFKDINVRKEFQALIYGERKLLDEFPTEEILVNNKQRSFRQSIQVWDGSGPQAAATITYLATTSSTQKCDEWHLEYFRIRRRGKGLIIKLKPRYRGCSKGVEREMDLTIEFKQADGKHMIYICYGGV
jgi:hypothetical protein